MWNSRDWNSGNICLISWMKSEKTTQGSVDAKWLEFPVVLPIHTLILVHIFLYSHSSQQQTKMMKTIGCYLDVIVSECFVILTYSSLLTMISIRLRNNQCKDHNAKNFSSIQLIRLFCPLWLNHQQKLSESGYLYCYYWIKWAAALNPEHTSKWIHVSYFLHTPRYCMNYYFASWF